MKCDFCGRAFDEGASRKACSACALFGGCRMIKCPHCGCEMPAETPLVKAIRRWRSRRNERSAR